MGKVRVNMELKTARCMLALITIAVAAAGAGAGQQGGRGMSAAPVDPHDLSGFWQLSFDSRKVPAANLAPGVTKAMIEAHAKSDAHAIRWCNLLGVPFIMDAGVPLDIRVGTRKCIIDAATNSHPGTSISVTSIQSPIYSILPTIGDSIGHWEGDTLVVDTIGFNGETGVDGRSPVAVSDRRFPSCGALSIAGKWIDSFGDVYVDRSQGLQDSAYVRVPVLPAPEDVRAPRRNFM